MMAKCRMAAIILAGGRGKRMNSTLPKVLHEVGGRPMIHWVVDTARQVGAHPIIVVVGRGREQVEASLHDSGVTFAFQPNPYGTADAVKYTQPLLENFNGGILVLSGDVPGVSPQTIRALCQRHQKTGARATLLTAEVEDPTGYGRVIKDDRGHLLRVVEEKDTTEQERLIREINGGIYFFDTQVLFKTLPLVENHNNQNEYYLPDVLYILREQNQLVAIEKAKDYREILGVNTKEELRKVHEEVFD